MLGLWGTNGSAAGDSIQSRSFHENDPPAPRSSTTRGLSSPEDVNGLRARIQRWTAGPLPLRFAQVSADVSAVRLSLTR